MLTYGDGVADLDIRALLKFHPPRQARDRDHRPPASALWPHRLRGQPRDRVLREAGDRRRLDQRRLFRPASLGPRLPRRRRDSLGAEPLERSPTRPLMAYRHEGFCQPMDTLREKRAPGRALGLGDALRGRSGRGATEVGRRPRSRHRSHRARRILARAAPSSLKARRRGPRSRRRPADRSSSERDLAAWHGDLRRLEGNVDLERAVVEHETERSSTSAHRPWWPGRYEASPDVRVQHPGHISAP